MRMQPARTAVQAKLCTQAEQTAAYDEVRAIGDAMEKSAVDEASAKALRDRTVRLLGSRCFGGGSLMPNLDLDQLRAARGVQFKAWWREHGDLFVRDALTHANALHFTPSLPKVLSFETLAAGDPLRSIVCPSDAVCDPLAEGSILDLGREIERVAGPHVSGKSRISDNAAIEACAREKPQKPDGDPLLAYQACVSLLAFQRTVLPAGHYRSPRGWLVLRGRRGHYDFCDEIRAYHLPTGSAYIASRCSGLVLRDNGQVDHGATGQKSRLQARTGTLSVDALRRLALLLWLEGSMVEDFQPYAEFPLPEGIAMPEPGDGFSTGVAVGGWASSAQTSISFTLVDGGQVLRAGAFTWPSSSDTGDQIADDLVVAAETTFQPGCPPVALPAALAQARSFGGVSALDASAASLRESAEALSQAMAGLKCRAK
ncbi:Hypothetical protein A7982_02378 [Minicystis rosea]|nr:Hypothetical protein A7982_02378 [Minicystis rosea]